MSYQIFLTDEINVVELDTESIDVNSVFSLLDITNIGARKENIKTIRFKGTKTNNNVFGSFFDLGRTSDLNNPTGLFFNYNPLISVTALVYEDSNLIFKGSLRITQIQIDKDGQIIYDTVLTGAFIDLKTVIQDKYLSDLDFTDLKHNYVLNNIVNSWETSTERFNQSTNTYSTKPFEFGSGYVYPNIDYGYIYSGSSNVNQLNLKSFKPAIYVKEYMNRIFNQDGLNGFSYEIKGSNEFKEMFNHLVIPDCQEGNKTITSGQTRTFGMASGTTTGISTGSGGYKLIPFDDVVQQSNEKILDYYNGYNNLLYCTRNFTSSAKVEVTMDANYSKFGGGIGTFIFGIRLIKRPISGNPTPSTNNWTVIGQDIIQVSGSTGGFTGKTFSVHISTNEFFDTDQLAVDAVGLGTLNYFTVTKAKLSIPADASQTISYDITPSPTLTGDTITIQPPVNIKQIDFLKSIINQFNFVVYTENTNSKRIIFEKYDDYYSLTLPQYIKNNSLNWSNKIDYSKGFIIKSNIDLPKSYLFTYKTDIDFLTDLYTKKFNQVYGSLSFNDNLGLAEQKKIELIFSPLITTNEVGTDRQFPLLYKVDGNMVKLTKTNPRIGYYNGLQPCVTYTINNESSTGFSSYYTGSTYPQISNYYIKDDIVVNDIHFDVANEIYITLSTPLNQITNSYQNYYINQTTDLTNPNITYVECNAYLNEIDISNIDLKIPVFINTGTMNGAYFKVLKIEYQGNTTTSKILLQKIGF